ncbi:MAG: hypothetical protein U9Q15_01095 [Patescibacteria group bacterium]|nr:hypothetical protein [Patescibacteria group bacterium]
MARQKSKQLAEFFQHPEHLFDGMKDFTISHPNPDNIILEIGPGNGDYFAHLVSTNPGKLCIGVDLRNDRLVK